MSGEIVDVWFCGASHNDAPVEVVKRRGLKTAKLVRSVPVSTDRPDFGRVARYASQISTADYLTSHSTREQAVAKFVRYLDGKEAIARENIAEVEQRRLELAELLK